MPMFDRSPSPLRWIGLLAVIAVIGVGIRIISHRPSNSSRPEANRSDALRIALKAATERGDWRSVRSSLDELTGAADEGLVDVIASAGEASFQAGHVDTAEACFRRVIESRPQDTASQTRLAYVLSSEGRRWEAAPLLMELLQQGECSIDQLLWLADRQAVVGDESRLEDWLAADPSSSGPRLGAAVRKMARRDFDDAVPQLISLVQGTSSSVEAGVRLGHAVFDQSTDQDSKLAIQAATAFLSWQTRNAANIETHPDLWAVRGRWLQQVHRDAAIHCYLRTLEIDPDHRFAAIQLIQLLQADAQNRSDTRSRQQLLAELIQRARLLEELNRTINLLNDNRRNIELMRRAADLTEQLGRPWEAWGWYRMALTIAPKSETDWQQSNRLQKELDGGLKSNAASAFRTALKAVRQEVAVPDWNNLMASDSTLFQQSPRTESSDSGIAFDEVAKLSGIEFSYFNSADDQPGARSYEFTGGGVAVIDYDIDGWPDLYFTQGCRWPHQPGQREHLDRLIRNGRGLPFRDVTTHSGIVEDRFGQGVTVGDFDSDGFPDLYVANIGPNRFFRNNGDGTFQEVTDQTGTAGNDWSTSCVLADVNGDGHADLFVVNYLAGDDVYDRICRDPDGTARLCYPQVFPSAPDKLYLNGGDGTFVESTVASGIRDESGRGMGVVAADFEGRRQIELFVANDTTANFYFRNEASTAGVMPEFSDQAIAAGLAFGFAGQAQAGMGIAAADADRDGRLDMFVTNFEREYNNLYLQRLPGLFSDEILRSRIGDAGYLMLGFGTQFLDADRDGWPDLFVANGHIDDFTRLGIPYRMPAQFFRNSRRGEFHEQGAKSLGGYFEQKHLGRAVARLDYNRDGLDDIVVGHLDEAVALLENRTTQPGHFLGLRLHGRIGSRDAIGTRMEVQLGSATIHAQLTAGDGYQASNERLIVIGLGAADRVEQLIIHWPGGSSQTIDNIPGDTTWAAIEGRRSLVPLQRLRDE